MVKNLGTLAGGIVKWWKREPPGARRTTKRLLTTPIILLIAAVAAPFWLLAWVTCIAADTSVAIYEAISGDEW